MKEESRMFTVIQGGAGRLAGAAATSRLRIVAAVIVVAVLVAAAARWPRDDAVTRAQEAPLHGGSMDIEYFPAQFVNQATEAEEHIPAF
jgi:hypothetical protein